MEDYFCIYLKKGFFYDIFEDEDLEKEENNEESDEKPTSRSTDDL